MPENALHPAIRLNAVSKTYGEGESAVHAVEELSLQLEAGKLYILMGPSGSGKTTLLMLMGCLLKPTRGEVFLFDREVSSLGEAELPLIRREKVGFIFQGFNLFPALTALENVEATLNLKRQRGPEARSEAARLLEHVGLGRRLDHLPEDLSGGEKQRVAVARALAGDPPIILADEPTGQLDSKTGRLIVEVLKDLAHQENRLIFMVSHDTRVLHYADRIFEIDDGRLKN